MKKYKSLLWFAAPFLLLLAALPFSFSVPKIGFPPQFMSRGEYLRLLINDSFFLRAIFNTMLFLFLTSAACAVIMFVVLWRLRKKPISNKGTRLFYIISLISVFIVSLARFFIISVILAGLPHSEYNANTVVSAITSTVYLSALVQPLYLLLSTQSALFACFFVRLFDIRLFTKNRDPQSNGV